MLIDSWHGCKKNYGRDFFDQKLVRVRLQKNKQRFFRPMDRMIVFESIRHGKIFLL